MTCYGIWQVAHHVFYNTPVVPFKTLLMFSKPHQTPKRTMKTLFLILAPNGMLHIPFESAFYGDFKYTFGFVSFVSFEIGV